MLIQCFVDVMLGHFFVISQIIGLLDELLQGRLLLLVLLVTFSAIHKLPNFKQSETVFRPCLQDHVGDSEVIKTLLPHH